MNHFQAAREKLLIIHFEFFLCEVLTYIFLLFDVLNDVYPCRTVHYSLY